MESEKRLTLLGHLQELRQRLVRSVIAVVITTAISFVFASQLFGILTRPIAGTHLVYIEMTEMLGVYMRVCLLSGIILAMPYVTLQFLFFVSPALTRQEKRAFYLVLPWIALMFMGGVVFGYFVLLPPALGFLVSFGSDIATPQIRIGNYVSLVTRLLLAIGLVFEMPVVTTLLARLGVVTPQWLAARRRAALILAFVLGAIITPTFDPINQTLVALPLVVLYEMSIWLARLVARKSKAAPLPSPAS